jgi:hypothetical protein
MGATTTLPPIPASVPPPVPTGLPASTGRSLPPPMQHPGPFPPAAPHGHYPVRPTSGWCAWGFGLSLAGFFLSPFCGIGLLLAAPALLLCILGFAHVQSHPEHSGRGLAVAGAVLSSLALIVSIAFLVYIIHTGIKSHEWTVTEQSSSSSE